MSEVLKIAIIGDYNFTYNAHHATNLSLDHASDFLETEVNYYWIKINEAIQLIRRIRDSGVTVLLIEHHMRVVMGVSDRICVLNFGKQIAQGTPEHIRNDPACIEAYLGKEEIG